MKKHLKILLLEDNPSDAGLIKRELSMSGLVFTLHVVDTREDFIIGLNNFEPDIILSDHALPKFNSLDAFAIVNKNYNIPFILVTGTVSEEFAVSCMKAGVNDYILKHSLKRLPASIENILAGDLIKREKEAVEELHRQLKNAFREIEEKNKNITDSIIYARKLQEAMLTETDMLDELVSDWFVYNQAKDIVSGDFYWLEKCDDKLIIAVVDCTGHGVPGALMSVAGTIMLNKIINEKQITKPADILDELNVEISNFFRQKDPKDGMDVAVCSINLNTHLIEFAGANRPLWIMHQHGLEEIKGTKRAISGTRDNDHELPGFKTNFKQAEPGDMLYLFTDGVIDQFGGEKSKKLMKKRFKTFLSSLRFKHMIQQKVIIENYMNDWKGDHEQVDDMLLFGLKL
ncbi:MAG: response regulator containing a CheY-like receiver domain and an domain [Bacteroidota bacterium]|nr:response regulator containing a CheY-like receiver domain and an domain [Bacteroidota bacterium]